MGIVYQREKCASLQTRSDLCIRRNETAQPHSQFPHSCIPRLVHLFCCSKICEPIVEIYNSLRNTVHECRNWERNNAVSFLRIFVLNFRYRVFAVWNPKLSCGLVDESFKPLIKKIRSNFLFKTLMLVINS